MKMKILCFSGLFALSAAVHARTFVSVEADQSWQSRNVVRIPNASGTLFSLSDFSKGPFSTNRVYAGYSWNNKHELRALYAPLAVEVNGKFSKTVNYQGETFASGVNTVGFYKFNSYRLSYAYHFQSSGTWDVALGFTGKIRDAAIKLTQGTKSAEKTDVGFVPLLNFQAARKLSDSFKIRFDVDGSWAPQGRAVDAALFLEWALFDFGAGHRLSVFGGYRTIEGGADVPVVYNFAWIQKAVVGLRGDF